MDLGGLLISLVGGGALTYCLGWLSGRKKSAASLEEQRLNNIRTSIEIYGKIHDDLKAQLEKVTSNCIYLSKEIEQMRRENEILKDEIHDLKAVLSSRSKLN